ncbi:hypothetical protein KOR42_22570 [Thalassoglobus neptunius]|uniref:Uncharacterized protein n=1 Tax=Thalassoglobus neptunius TaxID=1938619 RepID=A0A5C5X7F1_9PLAN|nr:hypothetical protein [Thalassoglobus neptunius]TWT58870.1 hypothetical protein KOR42_22570 [Thalassoglobus neptunius]
MAGERWCDIQYGSGRGQMSSDTGDTTVTLSHGASPSSFTFQIVGREDFVPAIGDVVLSENGREVLRFKQCAIDGMFRSGGGGGEVLYTVRVLDRRWKWWRGGGYVNGRFNVRKPDKTILEETRRSPRDLAKDLLKQLGESSPDVRDLPSEVEEETPEIVWDYVKPAAALQQLCEQYACRIVLTLKDKIRIVKVGNGSNLPDVRTISGGASIESVAIPDSLLFVAGKSRWQGLLLLEPVGLDLDGQIKLWKDLSYAPDDGFESYSPEYPDRAILFGSDEEEQERARALAKGTVWRWFRIKGQPDGRLGPVPKLNWKVTSLSQYELHSKLLDTAENDDGSFSELDPYVLGQWYDKNLGIYETDVVPAGATKLNNRFRGNISLDIANKVVKMPEPVYRVNKRDNYEAPKLWLMCSYSIRDPDTGITHRSTLTKKLSGRSGTGAELISRPDAYSTVRIQHVHERRGRESTYKVKKATNNDSELKSAAEKVLDVEARRRRPERGTDALYSGFHAIELDGKIQQVTWSVRGGVGKTQASLNTEHSTLAPSFEQRLRVMEIETIKKKVSDIEEAQKDKV